MSASDVESGGLPEAGPLPAPTRRATRLELERRTPVAFTLIAVCVALWALGQWWGGGSDSVLWYLGSNNGRAVREGEVYRLLSCLFLHLGWVHLALNMIALRALSSLELVLGKSRFLLLYSLSGLGASLATAGLRPDVISVGASGAIWGLMGAAFGMRIPTRHVLRARGIRLSSGWPALVLNLSISFLPGVDLAAHLGGGVVGFVLGATRFYPDYAEPASQAARRSVPLWSNRIGAASMALALTAALAAALVDGRPWRLREAPRLQRVAIPPTQLSLELPELVVRASQPLAPDGPRGGWQFGVPGGTLLWLKLQATVDPQQGSEMSDAELERWLLQLRDQIGRGPTDSQLPRTSLELTTLGGRPVLRDEYASPELQVVRYFTFVGPQGIRLDVFRLGPAPSPAWRGVEDRIAASLRYDAAARRR